MMGCGVGTTVHIQYRHHFLPNISDWQLGDSMDPEPAEVIKTSRATFPNWVRKKTSPESTFLKQSALMRDPAKYHDHRLVIMIRYPGKYHPWPAASPSGTKPTSQEALQEPVGGPGAHLSLKRIYQPGLLAQAYNSSNRGNCGDNRTTSPDLV